MTNEAHNKAQSRYKKTPKGKATEKKYAATSNGGDVYREARKRHNQTPSRKAAARQRMLFQSNPIAAMRRMVEILDGKNAIHF